MHEEIKRLQKKYNLTSYLYDPLDLPFELSRYKKLRKIVWGYAKGRILDAGMGTGRNIAFYPPAGEVIGIDLSEGMLKKARERAKKSNTAVKICQADILNLPFPDNHFDTIVATFIFCVIPDELQQYALRELSRVCKKGGEIILLEYTLSQKFFRRFWMKVMSPYVKWLYGAGFERQTSAHIKKEHLQILEERFLTDDVIKLVQARKPAS